MEPVVGNSLFAPNSRCLGALRAFTYETSLYWQGLGYFW